MTAKGRKKNSARAARPQTELAFDPIDAALRQIHDAVAAEAIPDDFLRLLDKLDAGPAKRSTN